MTRLEHLLWVLAEECAEVAQRASKAARFGMNNVQEGQDLTNEQRLWHEFNDLLGVAEMITEYRDFGSPDFSAIEAKKAKVERFLKFSEECGTLDSEKSSYSYR